MGRYRELMAVLVKHTNLVQRVAGVRNDLGDGIQLSNLEWQVFEYVLEHEQDDACMNLISERLGIPQSTFSKIGKRLCACGLVEKYQMEGNRKNILLRPAPGAREFYRQHTAQGLFGCFFDQLSPISDADLKTFTGALESLNQKLSQDASRKESGRPLRKL